MFGVCRRVRIRQSDMLSAREPPRTRWTQVSPDRTRDTVRGERGVHPDHAEVTAAMTVASATTLHREFQVLNQSHHMPPGVRPGRPEWRGVVGTAVAGQTGSEQFGVLVDAEQGRPFDCEQLLHRRIQIFRGADPDSGRAALPGELGPIRVPQRRATRGSRRRPALSRSFPDSCCPAGRV